MTQVLALPALSRRCMVALAAAVVTASVGAAPLTHVVAAARPIETAPAGTSWRLDPGLSVTEARALPVVVQALPGQLDAVAAAVTAAGGTVGRALPLVDGFAAKIPGTALTALAALPGVRAITKDSEIRFNAVSYTEAGVASAYAKAVGAPTAWSHGHLGQGVGVAVIDTGISPMNDFAGRVVHGPDLSGEGRIVDSFGHGTVMAGVIGGSGEDSANRSGGAFAGVAPRSTLVAVKAAGRNGATDVSTMLAAMHWVSAYKDQFNIRVLNLSWGTPSTANPATDPLNYAVQRLWQQGIVVVVAAGNNGPDPGTVTKPGDDPVALTVGAYDDKGNASPSDDKMATWSSQGPTSTGLNKPDVVAPGRTLIATRSFGSAIEQDNPQALVGPSYIKGSGTSQAAAVVSGMAALLLEERPTLTPDQVKSLLRTTALPLSNVPASRQGAGRVRLAEALTADAGAASQQSMTSDGLGSLEASRGGMHVAMDCGNDGTMDVIEGEMAMFCQPWNGASWTGASWTGASWTGASWTGASWTGASWTGASWTGASWTGASWTGGEWAGASWTGASWTGASWTGASWTGASWTGASWTGASWTGASWTGASYGNIPDLAGSLQTAFWGNRPRFFQRLSGELSDRPSWSVVTTLISAGETDLLQPVYADTVDTARYTPSTVLALADTVEAVQAATLETTVLDTATSLLSLTSNVLATG